MIRILFILLAMFLLNGCGGLDRMYAQYTGQPSEVCHDGVVYLQLTSGASVKYSTKGTVVTCN